MQLQIKRSRFQKVSNIEIPSIFFNRFMTGITELDQMFGEGILPGSSFTLTAQPGCGKTTLLLQLCEALTANGYNVGYASGEENKYQLAFTCKRLNVKNVCIANETDIDMLAAATKEFDVLVVDSFQALTASEDLNKNQLEKKAVSKLVKAAKDNECALFFIMHLTQAGKLKGSTLIPHSVDVNMQILMDDEGEDNQRIVDVYKNRFGPTQSYNATMTARGFEFSGKREVVKAPNKKTRRAEREVQLQAILAMDPPFITKEGIMSKFGMTSSQAYLALRELQEAKKIVKYGRGASAVFKRYAV